MILLQDITSNDTVFCLRHNVLNLSDLKERGLSFKVGTKGPEPQLRRTGYDRF